MTFICYYIIHYVIKLRGDVKSLIWLFRIGNKHYTPLMIYHYDQPGVPPPVSYEGMLLWCIHSGVEPLGQCTESAIVWRKVRKPWGSTWLLIVSFGIGLGLDNMVNICEYLQAPSRNKPKRLIGFYQRVSGQDTVLERGRTWALLHRRIG